MLARNMRETRDRSAHQLRGNGRAKVFHDHDDFQAFVDLLALGCQRMPMRICTCCLSHQPSTAVIPPRFQQMTKPILMAIPGFFAGPSIAASGDVVYSAHGS